MMGFDDAEIGVNYSELAEAGIEIVNHLRILSRPETRELLDRHRHDGDTFRCHQIPAQNKRGVLSKLRTSYLVEPVEIETGNVVDWTPTDRCLEMLDIVDEHSIYITETESSALSRIGARVWLLPEQPDKWWTTADIDVDLHPREIRTLADAGLVERAIDTEDGYSAVWRTSERMNDIAKVVWEVVTDD